MALDTAVGSSNLSHCCAEMKNLEGKKKEFGLISSLLPKVQTLKLLLLNLSFPQILLSKERKSRKAAHIVGRALLGQNQTLNLGFLPLGEIFFKSFLLLLLLSHFSRVRLCVTP